MGRNDRPAENAAPDLLVSSREFFKEAVAGACEKRNVRTYPLVEVYLVDLLEHFMSADRLFDEVDSAGRRKRETLAEMFLRAGIAEPRQRVELLKKVGDHSLYVSGFFGDSLQRKVVDVDYYAGMGGTAYATLADCVREDTTAKVYREFASRFLEFVDVLTHISTHALGRNEENIMRLYESYARTGSNLARERLLEKGLIAVPIETLSKKKQ